MIEIVQMSKRNTHAHTQTHTHTYTHTLTLRNNIVERVSMDENIYTPCFFRTIPVATPPFLWEKSDPHSFWRILRKLNPSLPFIKERIQLW